MTHEDLRQCEAERRAMLAELDAIDAAIDAIERRFGPHQMLADARIETNEIRVRTLAIAPERVH